jgi:hypothetical protein
LSKELKYRRWELIEVRRPETNGWLPQAITIRAHAVVKLNRKHANGIATSKLVIQHHIIKVLGM